MTTGKSQHHDNDIWLYNSGLLLAAVSPTYHTATTTISTQSWWDSLLIQCNLNYVTTEMLIWYCYDAKILFCRLGLMSMITVNRAVITKYVPLFQVHSQGEFSDMGLFSTCLYFHIYHHGHKVF